MPVCDSTLQLFLGLNPSTSSDGSIGSSTTGTELNPSSTDSSHRPATEREVRVVIKLAPNPDKLTLEIGDSAELNDPRPGRSFESISCAYERATPASPGRKPSSAVELLHHLKATGGLAQQIPDYLLLPDLRHAYTIGLEALKRDIEQV